MDLRELTDLISIRQYVVNASANPAIDRTTVNFVTGTLLLMDKKILNILQGEEFKEYIGYENLKEAKREAVEISNIRSGLVRDPFTGTLSKAK
jgi:hypothetical protein